MKRWIPPLAVGAAAFAAFAPALSNGFVSWDDPLYVFENPWIRGLSFEHARWAMTATRGGFWQPLTWLSLQFDYSLWGLEASGFHLTNLLLHAGAAVLFYYVCLELLEGRVKAATLAALFFAVHPLRVESVAWATERKGLLSALFFLAAVLLHRRGRVRGALAAFALSLAAKATGLTLPFVLLILESHKMRKLPGRRALLALAPFFALSAGATVLGVLVGRSTGVISDMTPLGPSWPVARVLYGFLFYPLKTLWPTGLSPYYPPPPWFGAWSWRIFACAAVLAAAVAALWRLRRSRPGVAAAFTAYAVMLLPTVGLVQQGQLYAACDRFSYLPCLGFAVVFGASLARSRAGTALAAAWLLALGVASWRQCGVWRDSLTLWSAASAREPGALANGELAGALIQDGRARDGIDRLLETVKEPSAQATAFVNLGAAFQKLGRQEDAREAWRRGLAAAPTPELSALLGASLTKDDITGGTSLLKSAVLAEPARAAWRVDLGDALVRAGRSAEARRQYAVALDLEPELGRAHNNLGLLLDREGRTAEAVAHYRAALRDPASRAEAHHNWGNVLLAESRTTDAERHYREALRLEPGLARTQVNLGNILARRGAFAEAAARYRAALKSEPRSVEARANLRAVAPFLKK